MLPFCLPLPAQIAVQNQGFVPFSDAPINYRSEVHDPVAELQERLDRGEVNLNTGPATVFIGRNGRVDHVHAGFAAPASQQFNDQLKAEFTSTIEAEVAGRCRLQYKARIVKIQDGREKVYELLLTNLKIAVRDSQSLWWIVPIYLTRWKIEETFRFVKQSYNLEDIRVMKYQRLQNLVILVTAAAYFAATFLGQQMKLRILCEKLLVIWQRFFGIPPFRFYALADGIRQILSQTTITPPEAPPATLQLELTLGWEG